MTTPTREELLKLAKEAGGDEQIAIPDVGIPHYFRLSPEELERFAALLQAQGEPEEKVCPECWGRGEKDIAHGETASCISCNGTGIIRSLKRPSQAQEPASVSGAVDELPPLPEGRKALFPCEDCDGTGTTGDLWPGSLMQPPEPVYCSTCNGSGRGYEAAAYEDDDMREYAAISRAQATQPAQQAPAVSDEQICAVLEDHGFPTHVHHADGKFMMAGTSQIITAFRALLSQSAAAPKLSVWYGPMPETNGKSNFTAILMRDGDIVGGHTIDRSEYPERVRYEADRVRYLIGELEKEPYIFDYDADKHSGYVEPAAAPVSEQAVPEGFVLVPIKPTREMVEAAANVDPERESVWDAYLSAAPSNQSQGGDKPKEPEGFYTFRRPEGWINLANPGQSWADWTATQGIPTTRGWFVPHATIPEAGDYASRNGMAVTAQWKAGWNDCASVFSWDAELRQQLAASANKTAATVQPVDLTLETAPVGTTARSINGGHWFKTERGWKWPGGSTFPRPGGDWHGELIAPAAPQPQAAQSADSRDAARYRSAIANDDNAEALYAAVVNNAGDKAAINAEFDAALAQAGKEHSK